MKELGGPVFEKIRELIDKAIDKAIIDERERIASIIENSKASYTFYTQKN